MAEVNRGTLTGLSANEGTKGRRRRYAEAAERFADGGTQTKVRRRSYADEVTQTKLRRRSYADGGTEIQDVRVVRCVAIYDDKYI